MLTVLRARNFKSWRDTGDLRLAPLTGLFGTNSSGKSSILQILLMLKQTVESQDRKRVLHTGDQRSLVDLGTYFDLVHNHREGEALEIVMEWDLPEAVVINDPENKDRLLYDVSRLAFATSIREEGGRAVVDSFRYRVANHGYGMQRKNGSKSQEKDRYDLIHEGYEPKRTPGRPWPLPSPVKCYGFPDEATGYYQNMGFLPSLVLEFEALFSRISYLGPLREYPQRSYVWAGESPLDAGRKGELAVPALLASRRQKTISRGRGRGMTKQTVEEKIAEWLQKMGLVHSFSLQRIAENRKEYEVIVLCYYVLTACAYCLPQHGHCGRRRAMT